MSQEQIIIKTSGGVGEGKMLSPPPAASLASSAPLPQIPFAQMLTLTFQYYPFQQIQSQYYLARKAHEGSHPSLT